MVQGTMLSSLKQKELTKILQKMRRLVLTFPLIHQSNAMIYHSQFVTRYTLRIHKI